MIRTATQLKAKIRNLSHGDNDRALVLIRNYIMERFLERVALSQYRNSFILKGGMLVSAVVGLEARSTIDIDTTVTTIPLTAENARTVIEDILRVDVQDGIHFEIVKMSNIMEDHDYPGVRFMLEASLDKMRQSIKIDISTGDVITPGAIEYSYKLMFEDRSISIWTYNIETLLAEKLETIMARQTGNTRMRDFYDIYVLTKHGGINYPTVRDAFIATCEKRDTLILFPSFDEILESIRTNTFMQATWENYRRNNYFVGGLTWEDVNRKVKMLKETALSNCCLTVHADSNRKKTHASIEL